jgi:hypothetical protein
MEINKLENETTLVRAMHMTKVTERLLVTAKAEQIPRICSVIGFSSSNGLARTSLYCLTVIINIF